MKIAELQPLIDLLDLIEPTVQFGIRKMTETEIEKLMNENGDKLGDFRTKFKPSEALLIIRTRKHFKAMIEEAHLQGKKTV